MLVLTLCAIAGNATNTMAAAVQMSFIAFLRPLRHAPALHLAPTESAFSPRRLTPCATGRRGDLGDQLAEDGVAEMLETVDRDDEGARPADDVVAVIDIETGLERQDGQAVDDDPSGDRRVARRRGGPADIVGAVAGYVDDAALAGERALREEAERIVDGAADRGAAAEQFARRRGDGGGNAIGIAAALQLEAPGIDAARGVDGEDEEEIDRAFRRPAWRHARHRRAPQEESERE